MNGHNSIIEARRAHLKPEAIFFFFQADFPPDDKRFYFEKPENYLDTKQQPTVELTTSESWREYDFRFVTGCNIHIATDNQDEAMDLAERLIQQGAPQVVVGTGKNDDPIMFYRNGVWDAF
jgi:hypothetical protein